MFVELGVDAALVRKAVIELLHRVTKESRAAEGMDRELPPAEVKAERMEQVLVRIPPDLAALLRTDARQNDRTVAATIRRALRAYLGATS